MGQTARKKMVADSDDVQIDLKPFNNFRTYVFVC